MMYHEYDGNVDVVVKTVDSSHGLSSTLDDANDSEGSFNVRIEAKTTITTGNEDNSILYNTNDQIDAGAGFDRIILDTGSTIDFNKIDNIEAIDLSKDSFDLTQVTLTNVLDLVDGTNKELKIFGDSDDSISFRNITSGSYSSRNTWSKDSNTIEEDGKTFEVYRNSLDSDVIVKVEQVISDSII